MGPCWRPLVLVDRLPLPAVTGGRQRMWNYLQAIDELGPADLVVLGSGTEEEIVAFREALPHWGLRCITLHRRRISRATRLAIALRGRTPSDLVLQDVGQAAEEVLSRAEPGQPVVAIQAVAAAVGLRLGPERGPLVVDLWDVEDVRLAREMQETGAAALTRRELWRAIRQRSDLRAWRHFHVTLAGTADVVTVCSAVDREAMPDPRRTWVVPNGADVEGAAAPSRAAPPVVLFHGQNTYGPNVEAAQLLVREVQPLLRAAIPDVRIRIVGRADDRVRQLHDPPLVTVTGFVEDIAEELARAWVVVVPLRVGGGTRLKILEAFARGIPVVSTSVGAEGLLVEHGRHLLIADDPAALAACAADIIRHAALAARLTEAAYQLVRTDYDWRMIRRDLAKSLGQLFDGQSGVTHQPQNGKTAHGRNDQDAGD